MKKIFLIVLVASVVLFACEQENILVPESLLVEETDLVFVGEGETYLNRIWTTSERAPVITVPAQAQEWLSATLQDRHIRIIVQPNISIRTRSTVITVETAERSQTIQVLQNGFPVRKLNVSDIRGYSFQPGEGFALAIDGNASTFWHGDWGHGHGHPHWIAFDFEPASSLNLVTLTPRQAGVRGNGNWHFFLMYAKGNVPADIEEDDGMIYEPWENWGPPWSDPLGTQCPDDDEYRLVWKGDWRFYAPQVASGAVMVPHTGGPPITFELPVTVTNTTSVKFRINSDARVGDPLPLVQDWHSSVGGFASLAEAEFFGAAR